MVWCVLLSQNRSSSIINLAGSKGCGIDQATIVGATPLFGMTFAGEGDEDDRAAEATAAADAAAAAGGGDATEESALLAGGGEGGGAAAASPRRKAQNKSLWSCCSAPSK